MALNKTDGRFDKQEIINQSNIATFMAAEALSEHDVVAIDSSKYLGVRKVSDTADVVLGVALQDAVATAGLDNSVEIQTIGPVVKLVVATGETINYGDFVAPSTYAGKIRKTTTTGDPIVGISVGPDGSNAGDIIPVLLTGSHKA